MTEKFDIGPRDLSIFERLDYRPDCPQAVIEQTDVVLTGSRETNDHVLLIPAREYLMEDTIDLLDSMEQGLFHVNHSPGLSNKDLEIASQGAYAIGRNSGFYAHEAFQHAQTIFSEIPERIQFAFGPNRVPFSTRGRFAPPDSTVEFVKRFDKLRKGITDTISDKDSFEREEAEIFFRVGAALPIHFSINNQPYSE